MKSRSAFLLVFFLGGRGLLAAQETPAKGAKELFFDPTDGAVVSASQPSSPAAAPLSGPAQSSGPGKPGKKKTPVTPHRAQQAPAGGAATSLAARREPKPTTSNEPSSLLGLSYWVELVGQDGRGQQVTDSRIFRSGERIRLHFRSNTEGYIALLQLGSSGTSSVLFPDPDRGLADNRIAPDGDRILPTESAWFRFDSRPGTETILVLFGRAKQDLDTFDIKPQMDAPATQAVMKTAGGLRGSKDLILETETEKASEIGTYAVNLAGKPVVLEIHLRHQ